MISKQIVNKFQNIYQYWSIVISGGRFEKFWQFWRSEYFRLEKHFRPTINFEVYFILLYIYQNKRQMWNTGDPKSDCKCWFLVERTENSMIMCCTLMCVRLTLETSGNYESSVTLLWYKTHVVGSYTNVQSPNYIIRGYSRFQRTIFALNTLHHLRYSLSRAIAVSQVSKFSRPKIKSCIALSALFYSVTTDNSL